MNAKVKNQIIAAVRIKVAEKGEINKKILFFWAYDQYGVLADQVERVLIPMEQSGIIKLDKDTIYAPDYVREKNPFQALAGNEDNPAPIKEDDHADQV